MNINFKNKIMLFHTTYYCQSTRDPGEISLPASLSYYPSVSVPLPGRGDFIDTQSVVLCCHPASPQCFPRS